MPKFRAKPVNAVAWIGLVAVGVALVFGAVQKPVAATLAVTVIGALIAFAIPEMKRERTRVRALATTREGQSICDFARDFDTRAVDPWVIRAVYEQLQWQLRGIHPAFPVRADDRLKEDLNLDDDDIDLDLAPQIEQRTSRSLENWERNPHFGKVKSARDLVLFFEHQPRGASAA